MAVLRKLVSRFTFDVDKKSVQNYEKTIGGMKSQASKLGAVLGLSLSGKALFGLGVSAKQASEDLKRLSGEKFDALNQEFTNIRNRVDEINSGASNILRKKTFNVLAASFIKDFGAANKEIETFSQLLETATLQSAVSGVKIEEIFTGLTQAIKSGDFGVLTGVGGFDLKQQKVLEDVVAAMNPKEIGGEFGRQINAKALLGALESIDSTLKSQAENANKELINLRIATEKSKEITEKVSEVGATEIIKQSVNSIEALTNQGAKAGEALSKILSRPLGSDIGIIKEGITNIFKTQPETRVLKPIPAGGGAISRGEFKKFEINLNSNFTINESTDAKAVTEEIRKGMNDVISDAKRQLIPSEEMEP